MTRQPDLSTVWRRLRVIVAWTLAFLVSTLLIEHRADLAIGLSSGCLIALLNARLLIRHIEQSSAYPAHRAAIIVQRGMAIRFTIIVLSSIVLIDKASLQSVAGFVVGLLCTLLLGVGVATRIVLAQTPAIRKQLPSNGNLQKSVQQLLRNTQQ
ncbi:MAG: ATP synthase subunit I [Chloroflexi bacterium]|nr:ATP synthase subunit I [Chloroflexota bacterium]